MTIIGRINCVYMRSVMLQVTKWYMAAKYVYYICILHVKSFSKTKPVAYETLIRPRSKYIENGMYLTLKITNVLNVGCITRSRLF